MFVLKFGTYILNFGMYILNFGTCVPNLGTELCVKIQNNLKDKKHNKGGRVIKNGTPPS